MGDFEIEVFGGDTMAFSMVTREYLDHIKRRREALIIELREIERFLLEHGEIKRPKLLKH